MRFLEVKNSLKDLLVFTTKDIKKIDPDFFESRLTEWQEKGYIKKVIKGYYIFSDAEINELTLFAIANQIYSPSYVSLESAFRYYNLIPEGVFTITSVSTKKTQEFNTDIGNFQYKSIKEDLYRGYKVKGKGNSKFKIATIEKAIVDYFYLNSSMNSREDFEGMRFNIDSLKEMDEEKLNQYANLTGKESVQKRIKKFLNYYKNA
jgi:predicted transcriptional regulator of viral defense system